MKVVFGGSWISSSRKARVAIRNRSTPDNRYYGLGLRLARSPEQKMAKEEPPPRKS